MAELAIMAATSLGASAGTAATIGTIASVGLTAASAFSSLQAGNAEASSLKLQARQSDLNARAERLQGRQQALAISERLSQDLASQNALFGARGQLSGEGSAEAAREKAKSNASSDIKAAQFNSELTALSAEQRSSNARSDATAAKSGGVFDAIKAVGSFKAPVKAPTTSRRPTLLSGLS